MRAEWETSSGLDVRRSGEYIPDVFLDRPSRFDAGAGAALRVLRLLVLLLLIVVTSADVCIVPPLYSRMFAVYVRRPAYHRRTESYRCVLPTPPPPILIAFRRCST